jgi:hypothetical protein
MMIKRILEPYLKRDAERYPVVSLTGPRQSGKTTLAKAAFPGHEYVSLEPLDVRRFAREDPRGFLAQHPGPAILDEVQNAPDLLSYIQAAVDESPGAGRYVITGSQNLLVTGRVAQTLAGRCGILHLLPFSRVELEGQAQAEPAAPAGLFANRGTRLDLWRVLQSGFYPPIHDRGIPADVWLADYLQTYLERDVRGLSGVGDLETFERFLGLCAGRAARLLNLSALAADAGVAVDTARRWVSVLKACFIVFLLPPHHRNFNKRLVKTPKLYFHDTGLLCHLLGLRDPAQLPSHPLRGEVFENYVVAEVAKAFHHHRLAPPLFFWRDRTGHEVDLLLETPEGLCPVEIKSARTVHPDQLDGLRRWSRLSGEPLSRATLVHGGEERSEREGAAVRPWYAV